MNLHKVLFEKYSRGELAIDKLDELHHTLIDIYFSFPGELSPDEFEYSQDLIIERFAEGILEEKFVKLFQEEITKDSALLKKTNLLRNLRKAVEKTKNESVSFLMSSESLEKEKKEEEELSKILQEAIEKVHAENESSPAPVLNLISKINSFFKELVESAFQPQMRLRLAIISSAIIVFSIVVWMMIRPADKEMISGNTPHDTIKNKLYTTIDSGQQKEHEMHQPMPLNIIKPEIAHEQKKPQIRKNVENRFDETLLAYAESIPDRIEYVETRSVSSDANDLFISAADRYEVKDYKGCIKILKKLINEKYFKSADTINEINFYLGTSYMTIGFQKPDHSLLQSSLQFFGRIPENSDYFKDSMWYCALIYLREGNIQKGLSILDFLLIENYVRQGEVKSLKESLGNKNKN